MAPFDPSILRVQDCHDADTLTSLLSLLLEPTPELVNLLVPSVLLRLTARETPPGSFAEVMDIAEGVATEGWTWDQKGGFLAGHPMIGEVKPVSDLSGKEQAAGPVTRPVVLARLKHLNELYCTIYPGLRYITFVNSRPRSAIVPELEALLQLPISPEPLPDDYSAVNEPPLDSTKVKGMIQSRESEAWRRECERGLGDVFKIARARLKGLGMH